MKDSANSALDAATPFDVYDNLLPRPRHLKRKAGAGAPSAGGEATFARGAIEGADPAVADQAYELRIGGGAVSVVAGGERGERWARMTLEQLRRLAGGTELPACEIRDWPDIPLRGAMLDNGRNYVDFASLKDLVDHLSLYKMNVFHWHLTDYFGWRLESKRHPELQSPRAATRRPDKFYTQREFRELVDYAWERGVTIVPELDVPGHTLAFRRGLGVEKMSEERVRDVVLDLIDELCSLAPADRMPYVHLGTDEVGLMAEDGAEWVPKEWITAWAERVAGHGRILWGWHPGEKIETDGPQVKEIWGWVEYKPAERRADYGSVPYVDSTEFDYINHIDPFELLNSAAFQKPCPWGPRGNRLGAMISAWHDDAIAESEDYFRQVPLFAAVTMYSDAFWLGRDRHRPEFFPRLPAPETPEFAFAADLERRVVAQRDKVLAGLAHPFPYVAQTAMRWRLLDGAGRVVARNIPQATIYPHRVLFPGGYLDKDAGVATLETWIRSPEDQDVGAWIGCTGFARSSGRFVDGPVPRHGEWNRHGATVELNGVKLKAPAWKNAGAAGVSTREIPMADEEYFFREPTPITLRKGWNHARIRTVKPVSESVGQKWIATFIPVAGTTEHPREVLGLEYVSDPPAGWAETSPSPSAVRAIVLPDAPTAVERKAAEELFDGLLRVFGEELEIVAERDAPDAPCFWVGATREAAVAAAASGGGEWRPDETLVWTTPRGLVLTGHPGRGAFYAVDEYQERCLGVRWWTDSESSYPRRAPLALPGPSANRRHAPPFRFRETYYRVGFDPLFKVRSKGNFTSRTRYLFETIPYVPPELGGDSRFFYFEGRGSAYHSFFEVLPPARYFDAHPEWYSLVDGRRQPHQLCLTNDGMAQAYIDETIRLLESDPDADFIQVSQNDWQGACECDRCRAVVEEEGAASGLYLRFANRVAEAVEKRFPNVTIDTFAYQFTRKAPKFARPRHNVTVRLCDIECHFQKPLEDDPSGAAFVRDLEEWSHIAPGQLYIWDYTTDFHSYMMPHPNFGSLAKNVRLFARSGATGVFEQGDALCSAGALAPLKHWYLAHLLWDPEVDEKALARDFLRGYYGPSAAPWLEKYIAHCDDCAAAKPEGVRCYHPDVAIFMTEAETLQAAALVRAAVRAAEADGHPFASRVRREALSVDHALLAHWDAYRAYADAHGIAWPHPDGDRPAAVRRWLDGCDRCGVAAYRETVERGLWPEYRRKLEAGEA